MFDAYKIRNDFPILSRKINGKPLVYLDNAATSQKPQSVIDSLVNYYQNCNANIHRGIHTLSEEATQQYEEVRDKLAHFIHARSSRSIIFTRNTTEAINLVAYAWGYKNILRDDEIVISAMEHHSNIVPWQILAAERGAKLVYLELTPQGQIDLSLAEKLINSKTKLVAITQMSNVLGTIVPIADLARLAHQQGALVLVDGAQGIPHLPSSIAEMDCDFLAFSLHKMLGPTGIGVLWAKEQLLDAMPPFLYGGDMISSVSRDRSRWNELPWKYEAGTPNIADVIATGAAIDYLNDLGMHNVRAHEIEITKYALKRLLELPDITIYGPTDATNRGGVIAFNIKDVHAHDVSQVLNDEGVAIRAGHHCCQPLMRDLKVSGTARVSFYVYNTLEEVDLLIEALTKTEKVMKHVAFK